MVHFSTERWADIAAEVPALYDAHWTETEVDMYGDNGGDLDGFRQLDALGLLHLAVARDDSGRMVGYAAFLLSPNPQMGGKLVASLAGLYLHQEARQGLAALSLLRYAESGLRAAGAAGVCYNSPASRPCEALYRRLGAKHTETIFYKGLK